VVTNKEIDALLLKQHSDVDAVVAEITVDGIKLIFASMYFEIGRQIEVDLSKIEAVLQHANGLGAPLPIDSNARSASWHDPTTNSRGRTLDEYLISKQLHILNEEGLNNTFRNRRGASNIDLRIITNQLLRTVKQWEISDQESSSDHNIIKYVIGQGDCNRESDDFQDVRYLFKKENYAIFQENLIQLAKTTLCSLHNVETAEDLDIMLCARTAEEADIEKSIEEFHVTLKTACNKTYRKTRTFKKKQQTNQFHGGQRNLLYYGKEQTPSDRDIREREMTMNSEKDANCNTMKARRNMQQPSKEKSSGLGRIIVMSRLRPTLGTTFTN